MNEPAASPASGYRRFSSMREYEELIDQLIPRAQATIRVFDRMLSAGYNSPQRYDLLSAFLKASRSRRLFIVVHDAGHMERDCPRLVRLAVRRSYAVTIHQTTSAAKQASDAFVIIDSQHYLHRFHQDHMFAAIGTDDDDGAQQLSDRFDEIWQASSPARIGATTAF
jgi:hypothetical protein